MAKRILIACFVAVNLLIVWGSWNPAAVLYAGERDFQAFPGAKILTGTVSSREQIALSHSALVHVELIDASQKDPRKSLLGKDTIWPAGLKLPITFRIPYDPSRIDPGNTYIVRVRITEKEKILFASFSPTYVLTRGAPAKVVVTVSPVSTSH